MNEGSAPAKRYYVQLPGYQHGEMWDEEKYNRNRDQLFKDHKDAIVLETSPYEAGSDIADNDVFTVHLPGFKNAEAWDGSKLTRNYERLTKEHPDVEIVRTSPVDYWGGKLADINGRIAELKPKRQTALDAVNDPANTWDEETDAATAVDAARRSMEASGNLKEINARLADLYRERENNPAWQSEKAAKIQRFGDEIGRMDEMIRRLNADNPESEKKSRLAGLNDRTGMSDVELAFDMRNNPDYYRDKEALAAAKMFYNDALKTEKAPSRYDNTSGLGNFFRGLIGEAPETLSAVALAKALGENVPLLRAINLIQEAEGKNANIVELVTQHPEYLGYLSDAQKELVRAFVVKSATDWARSEDMSLGYQSGSTAMQSLGFMADFLIAGGIGEAAAKGVTKGLTKGIARASVNAGLKGAQREVAQAAPKFIEGTIQSAVKTAAITPLMPSSYTNFINNLAQLDPNSGSVDLSGGAILNALGDTFIENFSESAGTQVEAILGVPFKAAKMAGAGKIFANTKFGDWGKAVKNAPIAKIMRQAGWNGYIGEIGEEWYGNALRVMTGVDKDALKNFATVEQQIITLTSFAPMSLFGGASSAAQFGMAKKGMAEQGKKLSALLESNGYDAETIQNILDVTKAENPTQLAAHLAPVITQAAQDNRPAAPDVYKAVMDYADAVARYRVFDGLSEADIEQQRQGMLDELRQGVGEDFYQKRSVDIPDGAVELNSVRTITDADGNVRYVRAENDGTLALIGKDGSKSFLSADEIEAGLQDGSLTDSGPMSLNDYLDRELTARKGGAERVRMESERRQQIESAKQALQLGETVNVGTAEAQVKGVVTQVNPDGIVVESPIGAEPYTWEQAAGLVGTPVSVATDEEVEQADIKRLEAAKERKEAYNRAKEGTTFFVNRVSGDGQSTLEEYIYTGKAVMDEDGNIQLSARPSNGGEEVFIAENDVNNRAVILDTATESEQTADANQESAAAENDASKDFRGNPLPTKQNKRGETVVDQKALWNNDPEAWARWNDRQRGDGGENTKAYIQTAISTVEKERKQLDKDYRKETDFDKREELEEAAKVLNDRLGILTNLLATYNREAEAGETFAGQQRKKAAEEAIAAAEAGMPSIRAKWQNAPKIEGNADEIVLADGATISGKYVLTESDAPTASHNPAEGFRMTEGFPVDENGKTVNDRDYEHDKKAQKLVLDDAKDYDSRALQNPVVVTEDGVVLSGNHRTMASQIAAENGTDAKYTGYLSKYAAKYGFTPEQVGQFTHPRVLFVPDARLPYDAATFAKFNKSDTKTQSKTEKAVKAGKTITSDGLAQVATLIDGYEDINSLYNDPAGVRNILDILLSDGIITEEQVPELMDGDGLSGAGQDLVESVLLGSVLEEDALRLAMSDRSLRKPIASAIAQIITNNTINSYTLRTELSDAVTLVARAKGSGEVKYGESVQTYIRQFHLFEDDVVAEATVQLLADSINDRRISRLKKVLASYNGDAVSASQGQLDLYSGDIKSKEDILTSILTELGYGTRTFDTSDRAAEQAAAQNAGGNQEGETGDAVQGDQGSEVAAAIEAARQEVDTNPTDAQIEHLESIKDNPSADRKLVQAEIDRLKTEQEEIKPIGKGAFGDIYDAFRGKAKEAIEFLRRIKSGEAVGALHHKDIGAIDLVWREEGTGKSDGYGLAKLVKYHPEVLDNLQEILDDMEVTSRSENRVNLESKTHQATVRLTWDKEKKNWLLTAFEKKNSVSDNTTDTDETLSGKRNDTATPPNTVSDSKDTDNSKTSNKQTPAFSEGDEVVYKGKVMEVVGVHGDTVDLEYDPTGFLPVTSMGVPVSDVVSKNTVSKAGESVSKEPLGPIRTGKHTKTGEDLWIVTPTDRVSKEEFAELKKAAKELDGYYSSFKPNNGFIFKSEDAAKAFNEGNARVPEKPVSHEELSSIIGGSFETIEGKLDVKIEKWEFRQKADKEGFHGYKIGDKVFYNPNGEKEYLGVVTDFEEYGEHLPVVGTGSGPVMYEVAHLDQIRHAADGEQQPETPSASSYGASNTIVTQERYEELRKQLRAKLGQLNSGFDPELFAIGAQMAAYHIEAGGRAFVDFSKRMIEDFGDAIRPYLKSFYNGARDFPGMEEYKPLMDAASIVDETDVDTVGSEVATESNEQPETHQATPVGFKAGDTFSYKTPAAEEPFTITVKSVEGDRVNYHIEGNGLNEDRSSLAEDFDEANGESLLGYEGYTKFLRQREADRQTEDADRPRIKSGQQFHFQLGSEPLDIEVRDVFGENPVNVDYFFNGLEFIKSYEEFADMIREYSEKIPVPTATTEEAMEGSKDNLGGADNETAVTSTIGSVKKDRHTKTGADLWVVKPSERVSDKEFKELKQRAKDNGGYWSSFEHGFIFNSEEEANSFNNIITKSDAEENTDKQTASDTVAVVSEAESVASETGDDAAALGTVEEAQGAIERIDAALDKVNHQLALLGYYRADTDSDFHESYGYMKSAEAKAVKDADRLAKELAADLGIEVGRKRLAKANIAPAGGDISFRLPLNEGRELYVSIHIQPNRAQYFDANAYEDDLFVRGEGGFGPSLSLDILYRVENPSTRDLGNSLWESHDVEYSQFLADIRRAAKDYLPEQPSAENVLDAARIISERQEKKRSKKKAAPADNAPSLFDAFFGDMEESDAEEISDTEPEEHYGYKEGDKVTYKGKVATIYIFEDGKPVLDTGLAPVLYETADWNDIEHYNETDNGQRENTDGEVGEGTRTEAQQSDGRGVAESDTDNTGSDGNGSERPADTPEKPAEAVEQERKKPAVKKNTRNNRAERGESFAPISPSARFKANIEAIKTMKRLVEDEQPASKEDMEVLRKFSGWGGLGQFFNDKYSGEFRELSALLTDDELHDAAYSINTAYYTPVGIIDNLWDIAKRLGFTGGKVLEGSAGIGNMLASMPRKMSEASDIQAVELDSVTGNILKLLYPDADVHISGFQDVLIDNASVDLAITNVPFGTGMFIQDDAEQDLTRKFGANVHDFCIAKNVRKLKEGGIGIFLTTNGTLDKSHKLRKWLVNEGQSDVIGAFRLNNKTFGGTPVTSDIIIVRKRVNGKPSPNAIDVQGTTIAYQKVRVVDTKFNRKTYKYDEVKETVSMEYNTYFYEHPENMGGQMMFAFENDPKEKYRATSRGLFPVQGIDQDERLAKWAKSLRNDGEAAQTSTAKAESEEREATAAAVKEGQIVVNRKGEICLSQRGKAVPIDVNANKVKGRTKREVVKDYDALKTALNDVLDYQLYHEGDDGLKPLLAKLNKAYDTFTSRYGSLNRNPAISFLRNDVDFPAIAAAESYVETEDIHGKKKVTVSKTDVFKKRMIGFKAEPTPKTVKDGVIVSVNRFGRIDLPYIAGKLGQSEEAVRDGVLSEGLGFIDPKTGELEIRYKYLSGNVREKLKYAKSHNQDGKFDTNIKELEKVIPMDIPAHLIEFSLGSTWLEPKMFEDFGREKYGLNDNFRLHNIGGVWKQPSHAWIDERNEMNRSAGVYSEKCRIQIYGHKLMVAAMNNTPVTVSKKVEHYDGTIETITDKEASQACSTKIAEIKEAFTEWCRDKMLADEGLAEKMKAVYNDKFNAIVPMSIDDIFLPERFEGANESINLYEHQKRAVIRGIMEPLMLAHEVGSGKTFTLISTAMEMRRLGTAKKPMIVVQNATTGQFVSEAKKLYPKAKVLTVSERDRTREGRAAFYAKIKYNDWDLIIVPQSVFEMMPDSEERKRAFIQEKIDEKMYVINQAKAVGVDTQNLEKELKNLQEDYANGEVAPSGKKRSAKDQAKAEENAAARAKQQLTRRVDDVSDFDDMGIDALLIDEAHEYKRLGFSTAIKGVKGVNPSYSKKSAGVYMKTRSVFDRCGWKNVVFATGTPISNTAAEIWTFMKYLMPEDAMRSYDIYYFDDFVRNFGKIAQALEFTTSGKFKENTRFAAYVNLPELIRIWSSVSDTVLTREIGYVNDKIPDMDGGKAQDIFLPQSPTLVDIMRSVRAQLEAFERMDGKQKRQNPHIPLVMYGVAKRAAIDPRLVVADAKDEQLSKTNRAVEEIVKGLKEGESYRGTAAVFCDSFRRLEYDDKGRKVEAFNLFREIKRKLVEQGIPESQIAIMESDMTTSKKEKIFAAVNAGEIRVVFGSTQLLGTGVNIQQRLYIAIHMDAPDRPMDYTQRNGRILRQGNLHKDWGKAVKVLRFGVEDSLDVTSYQRLKTKAGFIDSVMNGKPMLLNGMDNRILEEEEEGLFDNPVAVLSGSQYALKKSAAERELRKYESKKKQHELDQIYIERQLADNKRRIENDHGYIKSLQQQLDAVQEKFPDGKVKVVEIAGHKARTPEEINTVYREYVGKQLQTRIDTARANTYYTGERVHVQYKFDGITVNAQVELTRESKFDTVRHSMTAIIHKVVTYKCPELGIDERAVQGGDIKKVIDDMLTQIVTGSWAKERIASLTSAIGRMEDANRLMMERRGKPFAEADKLREAKALVDDYTEKMRKEMADKEAKYANMGNTGINATIDIDGTMIDEEDSSDDDVHNREADNEGEGFDTLDRATAIAEVNRWAKRLGVPVRYVNGTDIRGRFREGDNAVEMDVDNHSSVEDLIATYLHEVVGHYGLRELFGEDFDVFLDDVYANASRNIRSVIDANMEEHGWSQRYATEEYLAELAERADYLNSAEKSFWRKVREALRNLFDTLTGNAFRITDDSLNDILRQSFARLEAGRISDVESKRERLINTKPIEVPVGVISGKRGHTALSEALDWYKNNIGGPREYDTETGTVVIDGQSIRSSLAHKYGQAKLDAVTSLFDGFGKATFLTSIPDLDGGSEMNHYFAYPISYNGGLSYVLCRAKQGKGTGRLYIHEVFPLNIIKSDTLQAAADEKSPRRGVALYLDLLREVLDYKDSDNFGENNTHYRLREKPNPEKTGIGYKVFYRKDGKLYPPMVANPNGEATPMGVWLDADAAPISGQSKTGRPQVKAGGKGTQGGSGQLAYRPGWHLGEIPYALQFNRINPETGKKELFPKDFVWAEVEYAADKDYQDEANAEGMTDNGKYRHSYAGLKRLPEDGFYRYRTNPNPETDPWIITGAMKVNRVLSQDEVDEIVRAAGREPQLREGGIVRERPSSGVFYSDSIAGKTDAVKGTVEALGVEIVVVDRAGMPEGHESSMGVYRDGRIYVCPQNCSDENEAIRTTLHEAVGHKGLRSLVGDRNMDDFCLDVFRDSESDVRSGIVELAKAHGYDFAEATEEYLARLVEDMDFSDKWQKLWLDVRSALVSLLRKVGLKSVNLNTRDLQWLMWQSYNANRRSDLLNQATRAYVAHRLGFDSSTYGIRSKAQSVIRDRVADDVANRSAAAAYNNAVNYWRNRLSETWVDMYQSVNDLVEAIEKHSGKTAKGFEDVRLSLNQQSSKGLAAMEKWERKFYKPMMDAVKGIMHAMDISIDDVARYVMLKHGIERNDVFAKRDAREDYLAIHDAAVKKIQEQDWEKAVKEAAVKHEDRKLEAHFAEIEAGTDSKYQEYRKNDYGGITALYSEYDPVGPSESYDSKEEYQQAAKDARHPKFETLAEAEVEAAKEVADFERIAGDAPIKNLWARINAATKDTLKHQYDSNMLTKAAYDSVSGMFKYYVPLRGFADTTAEDMYDYWHSDQRGSFTQPLIAAKGRKTEAESPFGYIGAMASSAIAADMKNETKLALYFFAKNRTDNNNLITISESWYEATGETDADGKKVFKPAYFPFTEDLSTDEAKRRYDEWEEQMQEKAKSGMAFRGSDGLRLGYVVHIDDRNAPQHAIRLKVRGKDYTMYVNGNPRAAQAINNQLNLERSEDYQKLFGRILRWFSGINTSYNPEFWISNAQRDMLFALMSVNIKEDSAYNEAFRKNFTYLLRSLVPGKKGGVYSMLKAMEDGTLGDSRMENLYKEFVENGGVTGYTVIKDNEEWENEIRKYTGKEREAITAVNKAFSVVQNFGNSIEQMTRFASYVTSREMGKGVKDSVNDAKELTVNFNRKGSGKAISFADAEKLCTKDGKPLTKVQQWAVVGMSWLPVYGRCLIMFFNASMQGLNAMYKLGKKNPKKLGTWAAGYFAMGVINAILHSLLDDDDDYLDIPDFERRNNLLLGAKGVYFKWAMPQEARIFYGIGDMMFNHIAGRTPDKSIVSEIYASLSDVAPLNPAGGVSALAPTMLVPFVEAGLPGGAFGWEGTNRDYKGAKIWNDMKYLSDEERKRTPNYQKAYQGTGKVYVGLSEILNSLSGGDYTDAGIININPARLEHYIEGLGGGALTTVNKIFKSSVGRLFGDDFQVRSMPFLSRVLTINDERYRNAHITEVFNWYKSEAEHFKSRMNKYSREGDVDNLDALYDSKDYEIYLVYENYKGIMKYYNDQLKLTDDKDEKRQLMREQDEYRKEMIKEISEK